jgi:hypothetical protein
MANNFDSNFTEKLMRIFLEKFESARVLSKNVNTQLLSGVYDPNSGDVVSFKRPTDFTAVENATGDLTGVTPDDIIAGKASGVVQNYITVFVNFDEADQALKMGQIDELLAPMATRVVTQLELNFARFMMRNSGLLSGDYGVPVTIWDHVANFSSVMQATGVPMDSTWNVAINPFTQTALASNQRSLGSGGVSGALVMSAHERAMISSSFANMQVMSATTLATHTQPATGDRSGTVVGTPSPTYVAAKDTMTQLINVDGFGTFTGTIPAGTVIQITGAVDALNRLNLSTREEIVDGSGNAVLFTGVLELDLVLATGAGPATITGPAIFENAPGTGGHNTVNRAIVAADVVTLLGLDSVTYQPNLFWHRQAFSIGSVDIKKLFSTDTLGQTEDGMKLRVSKFADGVTNVQKIRIDLRPAFAALNPFFAGQGWGITP